MINLPRSWQKMQSTGRKNTSCNSGWNNCKAVCPCSTGIYESLVSSSISASFEVCCDSAKSSNLNILKSEGLAAKAKQVWDTEGKAKLLVEGVLEVLPFWSHVSKVYDQNRKLIFLVHIACESFQSRQCWLRMGLLLQHVSKLTAFSICSADWECVCSCSLWVVWLIPWSAVLNGNGSFYAASECDD